MGGMTAPPSMAMPDMAGTPGGGADVAPVPPAPTGATGMFDSVFQLSRSMDTIEQQLPSAKPIIDRMRLLVGELQRELVKAGPPVEPTAPPV